MTRLKIKKQKTPFGCFMNCFGMVKSRFDEGYEFTEEDEFRLMRESFNFDRECYEPYLIDKLKKKYSVKVKVESDYLHWKYRNLSENLESNIAPEHKILSSEDYKSAAQEDLAIVLMDKWHIDMYTHFAHWVVISSYQDGNFVINDSWTGRQIEMREERFMESAKSLKERLRCSPVLIQVEEKSNF